ncbi:MAG: alkylation response protein AidB-like acyl-CoA dehydrogenase [Algoriphagus sp.]|jgi:alkylation response protein AidB-like acyl-CoA dehydrogenase
MATLAEKTSIKGGEFLIKETEAFEVFIPEEFTEEQQMIADTCKDFLKTEIHPILDEIDQAKSPALMSSLMDKAGELGLLGTAVPEEYDGFGMDFNTSMLVAEVLGAGHSFSVAQSAHTGIGTLPILYYGTEEQKKKYLPNLATGVWKAAYCLTEPDSGSDANSAKTKAELTEDGKHYKINGQKMWITNGGFADIFIVFAKLEDDKSLTAFVVEKTDNGITMNEPEKKLGIKGSDTRQVFFNDCIVPADRMLSARQNGFKIAVNILNIGRIKLGIAAVGGSKGVMNYSINYANERKQFGLPIGNFGAIKHKLGEMATKIWVCETACYRAGQNIDDLIITNVAAGMTDAEAKLNALEQFAIECAILKVHGSEVLDYVADEGVQIYGGMGYSADAPAERSYRDARINRIFEGTNEINRLLTVDMLLKRAMKGEMDLLGAAQEVAKEILAVPSFNSGNGEAFASEKQVIRNMKKAALMIAGAAVQKFMMKLSHEQEIMMNVADMIIEVYAAESALLRVEKLVGIKGMEAVASENDMMMLNLHHAVSVCNSAGRDAIQSFAEGDELRVMLMGLKRFTKIDPMNVKDARRRVADALLEEGSYCF